MTHVLVQVGSRVVRHVVLYKLREGMVVCRVPDKPLKITVKLSPTVRNFGFQFGDPRPMTTKDHRAFLRNNV